MSSTAPTETPAPHTPPKDYLRDIFLWRRKKLSFSLLTVATVMWVMLDVFQYKFLTAASWVAIVIVSSLFVWGNLATLLCKDPPSLSGLEFSEEKTLQVAETIRSQVEDAVRWLFGVAIERRLLEFGQVMVCLWILSLIGSYLDFVTFLYIGVLMGLSLPVIYVKYQDRLKAAAERVKMYGRRLSEMVDEKILRKMRKDVSKDKKNE